MSTPPAAPPVVPAPQASTEGAGAAPKAPAGTGAPPPAPPAGAPPAAPPLPAAGAGAPPPAEQKFELKMPEGSLLKPEHAKTIEAFAKEHGLSPKQAQAQLERESKALADMKEAEKADLAQKSQAWKNETLQHPDLGGQNLPRTTKRCAAALERFDKSGHLKAILDTSGIGDLPAVVAYLESIGAALESDRFVVPPPVPAPAGSKKDAQVLYG